MVEQVDASIVEKKLTDAMTPGVQIDFDPDEAEMAEAFVEDALSSDGALASISDLAGPLETPMFLGSEDTKLEVLSFPNKGSASDLYGRAGESIADAILRSKG